MAFTHGKDTYVQIDNTSASLADISPYTDSSDGLPGGVDLAEVTAFGDEGKKNVPGLEGGTFSIGGSWDAALDAIFGTTTQWKAATRSVVFGPAGNTAGYVKYTCEAWITSYTVGASVGDKVSWSATLTTDGVITRTTF